METKYYKVKNTFSPLAFIAVLLVTLIIGSALSWPYLWLEDKIPLIYLNLLIPVGAGMILGGIVGQVAKVLKMHSPIFGTISILIGFIGVTIIKWAMYIYNLFASSESLPFFSTMKNILLNPSEFWSTICYVNSVGTWGLSKESNITGIFLWIIWIGEIILFYFCFSVIFHSEIDIPFVEKDNTWATKYDTTFKFAYFNLADVSRSIEEDPNALFLYSRLNSTNAKVNYVSAELYRSKDGGLNYLTLSTHVLNDKNNYSTTKVIKHLIVDWDFVNNLVSNTYTTNEANVAKSF